MRVIGYVIITILISFLLSLNVFRIFPVEQTSLFITVVGLIYGLIAAFTINNSWERFSKIRDAISEETSSLINLYLLMEKIADKKTLNKYSCAVVKYCKDVVKTEWHEYWSKENIHQEFIKIFAIVTSINIKKPNKIIIFDHCLSEIREASTARSRQLVLAHAGISKIQWALILFLSLVLVVSLAFLALPFTVVTLFVSTAMIASIILILLVIREINSMKLAEREVSSEPYVEVVKRVSKTVDKDISEMNRIIKKYT